MDESWHSETFATCCSGTGRHLAATASDETLRLWDPSGAGGVVWWGHRSLDGPLVFSPNGALAVAMDGDGTARVWRVPPPSRTLRGHGERALHVVFSPDGRSVATDSDDCTVRLWDVASGRGRVLGTRAERAYGVEFSRDGRYVASAGEDGRVGLWDLHTGAGRLLSGHLKTVREIAFSPRADLLASAGADGAVRLWDTNTGTARAHGSHGRREPGRVLARRFASGHLRRRPRGAYLGRVDGRFTRAGGESRRARRRELPGRVLTRRDLRRGLRGG